MNELQIAIMIVRGAVVTAIEHIGAPVVKVIVHAILDAVGVDELGAHVDEWKAAKGASDAAFAAKFGVEP